MIENRSVPVSTVFPHVVYEDVAEAIAWLTRTFGFAEQLRYGDPVAGAQMHLGPAWVMLQSVRPGRSTPAKLGAATQSLTVFVEDVEGHFKRSKAAGASIVEEPHETVYGELQYAAVDFAGHFWLFSKHVRDVSPEEWGATVADVKAEMIAASPDDARSGRIAPELQLSFDKDRRCLKELITDSET